MALKTKAKIAKVGETLGKKSSEFTFIDPPMVDVPFSDIRLLSGATRKMPDLAKTPRISMGVDRIHAWSVIPLNDEKGLNGEQIYAIQSRDPRIRLQGPWQTFSGVQGTYPLSDNGSGADSIIEVTFYGTGINFLTTISVNNDLRVSVDGGAYGADLIPTASTILTGRNYESNVVIRAVQGLPLGIHTVKFRQQTGGGFNGLIFHGVEILDESQQMNVQPGEIFANGDKFVIDSASSSAFNSGFDGGPTLNGRGGRVSVYVTPEGTVGKAIQQTEDNQLNFGAADHTNESVLRSINWREFGTARSDDFTTLSSVRDAAFVLPNGTFSLVGEDVEAGTNDTLNLDNINDFFILTFEGTGLDFKVDNSTVNGSDDYDVFINGVSAGILSNPVESKVLKIVSGLPYGTHTVQFRRNEFNVAALQVSDFIVYGPKKPDIPEGSHEIGEYFLMADFVPNTTAGNIRIATGVNRKYMTREGLFGGSWSVQLDTDVILGGFNLFSNTINDTFTYSFWGTGFDFRGLGAASRSTDVRVTLDDGSGAQALTTTNFPTSTINAYGYTNAYNDTTGSLNQVSAGNTSGGLTVSGLPLGHYTVEFRINTAGFFEVDAFDVIKPISYQRFKTGSSTVSEGVQLKTETTLSGPNLGEAKAWFSYISSTNELTAAYNVMAVVDLGVGEQTVYFRIPFKYPYASAAGGSGNAIITANVDSLYRSFVRERSMVSPNPTQDSSVKRGAVFYGVLVTEDDEE